MTDKMTSEIAIRRLRTTDREAWHGLWTQYVRFYRADLPAATSERTFTALCESESESETEMVGLLAVAEDGRAIGLAHLVFHASTWAEKPSCYLEDLFVDRSQRGSRVASRLFEVIYETARDHGAARVYWHTQQYNGPARSLYDTVGQLTSFVVYEHDL